MAPLASVASLIPAGPESGEVGAVLGDLRQAVHVDPASPSGAAGDLLADFSAALAHLRSANLALSTVGGATS